MSLIALITADSAHNAATSCKTALEAGGHTVTFVLEADVGTQDFSTFDCIVTARTDVLNDSATAAVLTPLNEAGKPMVIGSMGLSAGDTGITNLPYHMSLSGTMSRAGALRSANITDNSIPIVANYNEGLYTLFSADNWVAAVASGQSHIGSAFMTGVGHVNVTDLPISFSIPASTARLDAGTTGGRIVVTTLTYLITGSYATVHSDILNKSVEWAITGAVVHPNYNEVSAALGILVMGPADANVYVTDSLGIVVLSPTPNNVTPTVGQTLATQNTVWNGEPTTYEHQWYRHANAEDAVGVAIAGATGASYTLVEADAGFPVSKAERATNAFGASAWERYPMTGLVQAAAAPTYDVAGLAGINRWYDPSDAATLTTDAGAVTQLNDKSGNAYHVAQSDPARQPTTGSINSLTCLATDGTEGLFSDDAGVAAFSGNNKPFSFLAVAVPDQLVNTTTVASIGSTSSLLPFIHPVQLDTAVQIGATKRNDAGASTSRANTSAAVAGTPYLVSAVHDGSFITIKINGVTVVNQAGFLHSGTSTLDKFSIGAWLYQTSLARGWRGRIGEIILCTGALDTTTVSDVEAYLADKWGITVS